MTMAKAIPLTSEALRAPQITPQAATPARSASAMATSAESAFASVPDSAQTPHSDPLPIQARKYGGNQPKPEQVPLQLRIPREAARAIKIAAAEREMTISDFMLMCFVTHIQADKTQP